MPRRINYGEFEGKRQRYPTYCDLRSDVSQIRGAANGISGMKVTRGSYCRRIDGYR